MNGGRGKIDRLAILAKRLHGEPYECQSTGPCVLCRQGQSCMYPAVAQYAYRMGNLFRQLRPPHITTGSTVDYASL